MWITSALLGLMSTSWVSTIGLSMSVTLLVISMFIQLIPQFSVYKYPMQIIAIIILLVSAWGRGGYDQKMLLADQINQLQMQVQTNKILSDVANDKLSTFLDTTTVTIDKVKTKYITKIVHDAAKIDNACKVDPEVIQSINSVAKGE